MKIDILTTNEIENLKHDIDFLKVKIDTIIVLLNNKGSKEKDYWMGKSEVMEYMGWSSGQWFKMLNKIPVKRIAGQWKILKSELDKLYKEVN